jgi:hypothetical protein
MRDRMLPRSEPLNRPRIRMHWGAAIAVVYVTFAVATVSFVIFAIGRPVELVSADYYEQSLQHDAHMRAIANAEALGSAVRVAVAEHASAIDIDFDATGRQSKASGASDVSGLSGATGAAGVTGVTGTITLYRPSDRSADRVLPLTLDANGHQRVAVGEAAHGRWIVKLSWRAAGQDFYREQSVLLP